MSDSFRCFSCDEFYSGEPAFEFELRGRTYHSGGQAYLEPSHNGGYNDRDPVGEPDFKTEWPTQKKNGGLCADCFYEYVAAGLRSALLQGRWAT